MSLCISSCPPNTYLTPDGSCIQSCRYGEYFSIRNGISYCLPKCNISEIYNYDDICIKNCVYPNIFSTNYNLYFCNRPCIQTDYYFINNNTCNSFCNFPYIYFQETYGLKCIAPCNSSIDMFYYFNGSCLSICPSPYQIRVIESVKLCLFDCKYPFMNVNGTCKCSEGYELDYSKTNCEPTGFFGSVLRSASSVANGATVTLAISSILISNPLFILGLLHLLQMFFYLNFMNINYPYILQLFLNVFRVATFEFNKAASSNTLESPKKFMELGYSGYFIETGANLVAIAIGIFLFLKALSLLKNIKLLTKKSPKLSKYLSKKLDWSLLIGIYLSSYLKISISSFLQLRALSSDTLEFFLSSIFGIGVSIFNILFPYIILTCQRYMEKNPKSRRTFSIFVEDLKINNPFAKRLTVLIASLRLIQAFTIVYFYYIPICQNFIILGINLTMLLMYQIYRPHVRDLNNTLNICSFAGFLLIHILFIILTFGDSGLIDSIYSERESIGKAVILICMLLILFQFSFGFYINIFSEITNRILSIKRKKIMKKNPGKKFTRIVKRNLHMLP